MIRNEKYTNILASSLFTSEKFEPQRTNNFELQIVGLDKLVKAGCTSDGSHGYSADVWSKLQDSKTTQDMILSIKSAFSPKTSISILEVPYGNNKTKFAGTPTYENGTITWVDYYDVDTELILKAWQAAAMDDATGAVGDASNYKLTAYLTMFSPGGRKARRWKLIGCWVSDVNGDDFSNDSNNVRGIAATFVFDRAIRIDDYTSEGSKSNIADFTSI